MNKLVQCSKKYSIQLSCPGYALSDSAWEKTGPTYVECWKQINTFLSNHTYEAFGTRFLLTFDWSQMPRLVLKMHRAHERFYRAIDEGKDPIRAARFPRKPENIEIVSEADKEPDNDHRHNALIVCRLHDIFLIANLSAPGSADFYRTNVQEEPQSKGRSHDSLNISGFYFELAFIDSHEGKWPLVKTLPVQDVAAWYSTVRTGYSQTPKNKAEKVLFALLHISTLDMSPIVVVWLFFALETLFDTKIGENFRVLNERIKLLLNPSPKQAKYLKKQLRELYDIRSSLVHGGFDLFHPMMDESIDKTVETVHKKWVEPTEVGFRVLLVSLQTIIERRMKWPQFTEVIEGENYTL